MTTCPQCGTRYGTAQGLCPRDGSVLEPDKAPELGPVGKVLDGKYRLDSYLSRGGMGAVYRATHVMLGRTVAVKLINPALITSADMVRRFQREARAVTHLNHPNIVKVYDLGQTEDGTLYIAMELVSGESLSALIKSAGALAPARIVTILGQVVSALSLAHRNSIVHRDLKPHNIMVSQADDGHDVATLLDFGIAKTFEIDANTKLTATGSTLGTPHYMSPEQASGVEVDARSDLYSLGIILYEMLVGEVPFTDPSTPAVLVKHLTEVPMPPSIRRPDLQVPPMLEAIALRCLEKSPANRFQTADELAVELQRVPIDPLDVDGGTFKLSETTLAQARAATPATVAATVPSAFQATPQWQPQPTIDSSLATTRAVVPGTRPTAPVAPQPFVPPPVPPAAPIIKRERSVLLPVAAGVAMVVILGAGYWAMTRPEAASTPQDSLVLTATPSAPPAKPAMATVPEVVQPSPQVVAPSPQVPTPPPAAPPTPRAAPPSAPAAPGVSSGTISDTALSRALMARLRTLMSERRIVDGTARVDLEMSTRASGLGRGITADYVATLRTSRGEKTFSGSHLGFAELTLRNEVVDKVAAEMIASMAPPP